jgi:pilus assembly protein Flp/PilA
MAQQVRHRGNGGSEMRKFIDRLTIDRRGVTALEYALIAALVAVVIIGGVSLLGSNISSVFSTVANTI